MKFRSMQPCDFECYMPNPRQLRELRARRVPAKTSYRRAVYALALARLAAIRDDIANFEGSFTGKLIRAGGDQAGSSDVVRRGKGIMPSLVKQFPELRGWTAGPAALKRTIERGRSDAYLWLLGAAAAQVEKEQGEQLELFVRRAPAAQLSEFPPVVYPPHVGNQRCRHCRKPHSSSLHRFHTSGAFTRTHPDPDEKRRRRRERDDDKAIDAASVPSWVNEEDF